MAKRTIKITIKLPRGVSATSDLVARATKAANDVVAESASELVEAEKLANLMAKSGVKITIDEILSRKKGGGARKKAAKKTVNSRKRVVLNDAKKKALVADLKAGAKATEAAKKYGVSHATAMNLKRAAGLTKPRATKKS
jgi:hypothetical protein